MDPRDAASSVLAAISDGVVLVDVDWRLTFINPTAERMAGVPASELLGRVIWEALPELANTKIGDSYRTAMSQGVSTTVREFRPRSGLWLETTAYPTPDGLAVLARDVTEAQLREQKLKEQDALLRSQAALLDNARDAIIVRDLDSGILYWNEAATRIYGWTREEVIGKRARDLLYSRPDDFENAIRHTLADGHWTGELRQISKSGESIVVESSWTLVRNDEGEPDSVFSVNTDITAKRREEQLALRTERMESLGTLASGIAHDLNNVLTPILMAVQLLEPGETSTERRELLASMEAAVKRGADMIRQVLSFATGATGRRDPIDVTQLLREVSNIPRDWPRNLHLAFEIDKGLWSTRGDDTQLVQVLLNLISNAKDAMHSRGTVTIRARNVRLADTYSSVSHLAMPGAYVVVEVEDEGAGIPAESLPKIFEPFYTTKQAGAGTGLGLSTSLAVIRGHGGYMQAYTEVGRGSTFRIHLPAEFSDDDARATEMLQQVAELPRGSQELVLVVDDEAAIRQMTRQTLDAYGYTTAVASNGAEAIAIIEADPGRVALVLTDMAMPVMDGAATAAYLIDHHPRIPVIVASGLNANGGVARAASAGVSAFLAKPYTTEQLLNAVAKALES
jgi:PAS domain S-box-containing protein